MRAILLVAMLGCGGGESTPADIHELGACDGWGGMATQCELICKKPPSGAPGAVCTGKPDPAKYDGDVDCSTGTFTIEGHTGCCVTRIPNWFDQALFVECAQ